MSRPLRARTDRAWVLRRVVADLLVASLALPLAYQFRFHVWPKYIPGGDAPDPGHYAAAVPVLAVTVVVVFWLTSVYRLGRGVQFIDEVFRLTGSVAIAFWVVLALIGLYYRNFPYARLASLYWAVGTLALVCLARYGIRRYEASLRARGIGAERVLIVGWGSSADLLVQRMRMFPDYGYQVVGILSDLEPEAPVEGVPVLGRVGDIAYVLHNQPVELVVFAPTDIGSEHLLHLIERCRRHGVEVRILPGMIDLMTTRVAGDEIDGIPLLQLRHGLDIRGPKTVTKRVFDVAVAGAGMVAISPLLALLALLVKLTSPGPVLIRQRRVGMEGRTFETLKFRSMRVDAEDSTGPVWAAAHDPRRTPIGGVLRRLSLDELPQLWNIVRGDMSLVGPRPERPTFVAEFSRRLPRYCDRHLVRPGLAGWAQANDLRGQTPVEDRLVYDLYYIENWSLAFDIKIILITLARVWTHKNAY